MRQFFSFALTTLTIFVSKYLYYQNYIYYFYKIYLIIHQPLERIFDYYLINYQTKFTGAILMDLFTNLEQFLRQFSELQRGVFTSWTSMMPMQSINTPNLRENFDKTLKFQETTITNYLEFQALLARMSLETQKQFWESYFNMLRKM
jgi:hypothetical protein